MIISHKYKFVYIHIPKTGGTFVEHLLLALDKDAINLITNGCGHQHFSFIKQMEIYDKIKNYTFFTIIINPIHKLISWYNYHGFKNYDSFLSMICDEDFNKNCHLDFINYYTLDQHDIANDPKIILIKLENLKEQLIILFKQLNIDISIIDFDSFFEKKINESVKLFTVEDLKQNNEMSNKIKNKILNNPEIMLDLYYYNL